MNAAADKIHTHFFAAIKAMGNLYKKAKPIIYALTSLVFLGIAINLFKPLYHRIKKAVTKKTVQPIIAPQKKSDLESDLKELATQMLEELGKLICENKKCPKNDTQSKNNPTSLILTVRMGDVPNYLDNLTLNNLDLDNLDKNLTGK